ncbi:MAG: endo-1,4-beta-xylanase [Opitutaceae bacterium]|nr:endo-1,4-beta-xylanase [Opitutaceae bacterium]
MKRFPQIAACLVLATCCFASSADNTKPPLPSGVRLKEAAGTLLIGARPDGGYPRPQSSRANTLVLEREFSALQPTWWGNWGGWSGPGQYDFAGMNAWINWGHERGKKIVVHMLVGGNQYMPEWLVKGSFRPAELDQMMGAMIKAAITGNENDRKVHTWNVVNEAFAHEGERGSEYKQDADNLWHQLGWEEDRSGLTGDDKVVDRHPAYIAKAFHYARQHTRAKLELRENEMEFEPREKRLKLFYQLVKHLLESGVPLDAVGLQCHMYAWDDNRAYSMEGFKEVVARFRKLGLEVMVTEIDMVQSFNDPELQRRRYEEFVHACVEAGVSQLHFWGVRDGSDKGWFGDRKPLLFDESFAPKPAYYGVQAALLSRR